MMERNRIHQRGYSLAEVLVAVAIFALIIIGALMIYDRSNRTFKLGVEASNVQQNTRVAFDKLVADLRMTGFDFDRDGIPTGNVGAGNQYQLTDEQFEFIAPGAVTIRSNFDFEEERTPCTVASPENCDNGREGPSYESNFFPVVTTANDEIVTYALVPVNQASVPPCNPATNCVQFYADVARPRSSFPDAIAGGVDEGLVTIPGVDLCVGGCNNPPYTLARFSLDRSASTFPNGLNVVRTDLATNIRSMTFTYYQDPQGTAPLMDLNNTVDHSTGENILGKGQWKVTNPGGLVAERSIRSRINAVRMSLVGMTEVSDPAYTDTAETVASARNYRKFRLDTLVAPRNILRRGMREQDTFAPGPPSITNICTGACAGVWITWTAPLVNNAYGAPDQYKVIYDLSSAPGFACETTTFTNTYMHVAGTGACALQSGLSYKFAVVALNSYGSGTSTVQTGVIPMNTTQPDAPVLISASSNLNGKVTLSWSRPIGNVAGTYSCPSQPSAPNAAELKGYRVERAPQGSGSFTTIADENVVQSPYDTVTWTDTTAANCVPYDYRVTAVEHCAAAAAMNNPAVVGTAISPASNVLMGQADAGGVLPSPPPDLVIDLTPSFNSCGTPPNAPGVCSVELNWPKATTDANGTPINVTEYRVYRETVAPTPVAWALVSTVTTIPATGPVEYVDTVTWTGPEQYRYRVTSVQCSTLESVPSPVRNFPCFFPPNVVGSPLLSAVGAFDGDGSDVNPWLVVNNATVLVNVLNPATLTRIQARVYNTAGVKIWDIILNAPDFRQTPASPQYELSWPMVMDATERVDVTVVDSGGCVTQSTAFLRDEAQGCCLVPFSDPTAGGNNVQIYSAGAAFLDIVLINVCDEPLSFLTGDFAFNTGLTQNGTKVDTIVFPRQGGGTTTYSVPGGAGSSFTWAAPALTAPVPAATVPPAAPPPPYKIRVTFSKNLISSQSPVTLFRIDYTQPSNPTPAVACEAVP